MLFSMVGDFGWAVGLCLFSLRSWAGFGFFGWVMVGSCSDTLCAPLSQSFFARLQPVLAHQLLAWNLKMLAKGGGESVVWGTFEVAGGLPWS